MTATLGWGIAIGAFGVIAIILLGYLVWTTIKFRRDVATLTRLPQDDPLRILDAFREPFDWAKDPSL